MKKKTFTPEMLSEDLKKFKLLTEYDFYQEKKDGPEYKDLILGDKELEEADDAPKDLEPAEDDVKGAADNVAADLGVGDDNGGQEGGEETTSDIPEPEEAPAPAPAAPPVEPATDDVEVDVTSLVKGSEEAKQSADAASKNTQMLLKKLNDLEMRVSSMSAISGKIDSLEKEIVKRNPTPVEKLEMRSLDSYPFNQKLSDYWAEKEGPYDVMNKNKDKEEFVLTKDEVDYDYSAPEIKKSFTSTDDSYLEENIQDYTEEII